MNKFQSFVVGFVLFILICFRSYGADANGISPNTLSCEYLVNPLGINTGKPRFQWTLSATGRNQRQTAYELIVSDNSSDINNLKGNFWQTGKVLSDQNIHVMYGGQPLKSATRYYWRVRVYDKAGKASQWSRVNWFETGYLNPSEWQAKWINDGSQQFSKDEDFYLPDPSPLFRKEFSVKKKIRSARLYIAGLGYYEAYLNGKKIGDRVLEPGWTNYDKEILYSVYDVTPMIKGGVNIAGIILGNGWYNPLPMKMWGRFNLRDALVTGRPCVKAELRLSFTDGSSERVTTGSDWQTLPGPVIRNSVYLGEEYDARQEQTGWCSIPGFKSKKIKNAKLAKGPEGNLVAQMQPPVRITKIIKPVSVSEVKPGVFVFDMGQNFAGVARISVQGPAGTKISIRYGEDIYADGSLNVMTSVAGQIKSKNGGPGAPAIAWQEDNYILNGKGREIWSPRFTFHGFRYVEITGWPGKPTLEDVAGLRMNADLERNGSFISSNQMFNQLDEIIQRTFLSNVFSVQSDCPAREKFGYGGDLFCTMEAFLYNYNMSSFYPKLVHDFINDQTPLGGITETAPYMGISDHGLGDASAPLSFQQGFPYLVYQLYQFYGDKGIVESSYPNMTRLIQFLRSGAKEHLYFDDLSDHESLDTKPIALTASASYYYIVKLMAEFSEILEKQEDKNRYTLLADSIKSAIVARFLVPGAGRFSNGTQTAQIYGLWYEFASEKEKAAAIKTLISEFDRHKGHLSTGIFGTKMMFDVLRLADQNELAYQVADQKTFPGWGFMLENGATTLWETWAPSDNVYSKNHPMFGSVGEWFYRSLLGINSAAPGFKKIIIRPQPAGDLTHAKGTYKSIRGNISSDWNINGDQFELQVEIPVNTTAEIWIPVAEGAEILEGGNSINKSDGILLVKKENGYSVFQTGSGSYQFKSRINKK